MKVTCALCGKDEEINKLHKDYKKIAANPQSAYFCQTCVQKLSHQAAKSNEVLKSK